MGDLNYRLNPTDKIDSTVMRGMATAGMYAALKELDQVCVYLHAVDMLCARAFRVCVCHNEKKKSQTKRNWRYFK